MNRTFMSTHSRSAFILIALLSLLLQVQSAFSCQMMEISGPTQDCCCDDVPDRPDPIGPVDTLSPAPCCDFSLEVSLNELDAGSAPLWSSAQLPDHDPPAALSLQEPFNDQTLATTTALPATLDQPPGSGTQTYLTTLRLRI